MAANRERRPKGLAPPDAARTGDSEGYSGNHIKAKPAQSKDRRVVTIIDPLGGTDALPLVEAVLDGDVPAGLITFHPGRWGRPHSWRAEQAETRLASNHRSRAAAVRALPRRAVRR
jgi:hypothetical protein